MRYQSSNIVNHQIDGLHLVIETLFMEKPIWKLTNNFERKAHPQHQQGQHRYLQYIMIRMMINLPRAINHYLVPHISTIEKLILRLVVVDRQSTNIYRY